MTHPEPRQRSLANGSGLPVEIEKLPECESTLRDDSRFRVQSRYVEIGQAPLPRGDHVGLLEAPGDTNRDVPDLQRFSPRLLLPRSGFVQLLYMRSSPWFAPSRAPAHRAGGARWISPAACGHPSSYVLLPHNSPRFEDLKLRTSETSSNRWRRRWTRREMSRGSHAA